ncbi:MAG: DUF4160 domain-containing protein [Leptolyngbyaceae cyanobacterium CSU_1_3]|nr:DUF4160 domain-containing protein [Leptolyngbyaceae cyanobacterium CSU_1_3]
MPLIAQFRGISVYMYTEPNAPHHLPHFHTYYAEYAATFTLMPPEMLEGALPRTQLRLVLAWAELHRNQIEENWRLVQAGQPPKRIAGI